MTKRLLSHILLATMLITALPLAAKEYKVEDVTRVWRQVGEDYKCIYKREFYRGKKL